MRERCTLCHHEGVRLSILTKTGLLSEDPLTAVELCQSVKGLGITLDPSYFICRPGGPTDFDVVYPMVLQTTSGGRSVKFSGTSSTLARVLLS